jgi:hypothetical protein
MKISGYSGHPKKKCDDGTERYSTVEVPKMFPTVAASLGKTHSCSREVLQRLPLSVNIICRYACNKGHSGNFIVIPHISQHTEKFPDTTHYSQIHHFYTTKDNGMTK